MFCVGAPNIFESLLHVILLTPGSLRYFNLCGQFVDANVPLVDRPEHVSHSVTNLVHLLAVERTCRFAYWLNCLATGFAYSRIYFLTDICCFDLVTTLPLFTH